jgi:hypothetical protein
VFIAAEHRISMTSVDDARRYIADFPLTRAGLIEWDFIALDAPLPLEFLFDSSVDVAEPLDRTVPKKER